MRLRLHPIVLPTCLASVTLLAAACGGGGDDAAQGGTQAPATPTAQTTTGGAAPTTSTPTAGEDAPSSTAGATSTGSGTGTTTTKPPASTGISPDAPSYIGVFSTEVTAAEAERLPKGYDVPGRWTLVLGDNAYNLSSPKVATDGRLSVDGKTMRFSRATSADPAGDPDGVDSGASSRKACKTSTGRYTWSLRGKTLSFRGGADACTPRARILAKSWTQLQ